MDLSAIGNQIFLAVLPNLLSLGLNGKVELTGEWINELDIDKTEKMKDWEL